MIGFAAYVFVVFLFFSIFNKYLLDPYVKKQGYPMHNSEFRLHPNRAFDNPCLFYTCVTKYILFVTITFILRCKYIRLLTYSNSYTLYILVL